MHSDGVMRGILDSQVTDTVPTSSTLLHVTSAYTIKGHQGGAKSLEILPSGSGTEKVITAALSCSPSSEVAMTLRECDPGLKVVRSITMVPFSSPKIKIMHKHCLGRSYEPSYHNPLSEFHYHKCK